MANDVAPSVEPKPQPAPSAWRRGHVFSAEGEYATYQLELGGLLWISVRQHYEDRRRWVVAVHPFGAHCGAFVEEGAETFDTRTAAERVGLRIAGEMLVAAMKRLTQVAVEGI